jgi:hypothetical protein
MTAKSVGLVGVVMFLAPFGSVIDAECFALPYRGSPHEYRYHVAAQQPICIGATTQKI